MSGAPSLRAGREFGAYRRDRAQGATSRGGEGTTRHVRLSPCIALSRRSARRGRYNEWILCLKKTENDEDGCKFMRQYALSLCPDTWIEKWDEEREEGTFSGVKMTDAAASH